VFVEEAHWVRRQLEALPLAAGARVLDIGSSTLEYRTVQQPHITQLVHRPLLDRGCTITCADIKPAAGVDLVIDLSRPDLPDATFAAPYDLVICSNILEHVVDRALFVRNVLRFCARGGHFLCTVPHRFPYHADPLDTMYRPTAEELARAILEHRSGDIRVAGTVRIDDRSYYDFRPGRILDHLLARRVRMRARWHVPALRWQVACVLVRIDGVPPC
jgi:SAM-dependent methyltransferase